jgi:uroporphyrinogen decarboxylase
MQYKQKLSHRERVRISLSHQEPDMVPIDLGEGRATTCFPGTYLEAAKFLGLNKPPVRVSRRGLVDEYDEAFLKSLDIDFRRVKLRYPPQYRQFDPAKINFDEWGIPWEHNGIFWENRRPPLKDAKIEDLVNYPWPKPLQDQYLKGLREEVEYKYKKTDFAVVACLPAHCYGIMTTAWLLRGLNVFMMDLIANKEFINELMNNILAVHKDVYKKFLSVVGDCVEIVHAGDDMGTQKGPFFSADMYKEQIQPKQKELLQLIKNMTNAKVFFHSCGSVYKLLDHMIDAGVDILNPIQSTAEDMELGRLKAEFGNRLCFQGAVDQQRVLTGGSIEDIRREVENCLANLSPGGGYILNAVHNVMPEVSGQNLVAMYRFARDLGKYH